MSRPPFGIAPLGAAHDRIAFDCGTEALNRYLREHATQDVRRRVAACFVASADGVAVAGYYTLAASSVLLSDLPPEVQRKLPRYPSVPVVRVGRLAVDGRLSGKGLGGALLADAMERTARADIAAHALLVDAKDKGAAAFYRHHGFIALPSAANVLFLPISTAIAAARGMAG